MHILILTKRSYASREPKHALPTSPQSALELQNSLRIRTNPYGWHHWDRLRWSYFFNVGDEEWAWRSFGEAAQLAQEWGLRREEGRKRDG